MSEQSVTQQSLFPSMDSVKQVMDYLASQLPITKANDLHAALMLFQNTLMKVQANPTGSCKTVTVTLTTDELAALDTFANKGMDEWEYTKEDDGEDYSDEQIADIDATMNLCDVALDRLNQAAVTLAITSIPRNPNDA